MATGPRRSPIDLDARFTPSGALVAVELQLDRVHSKEISAVLRAAHGEPQEMKLCARKGEPCEIAAGVWQANRAGHLIRRADHATWQLFTTSGDSGPRSSLRCR